MAEFQGIPSEMKERAFASARNEPSAGRRQKGVAAWRQPIAFRQWLVRWGSNNPQPVRQQGDRTTGWAFLMRHSNVPIAPWAPWLSCSFEVSLPGSTICRASALRV